MLNKKSKILSVSVLVLCSSLIAEVRAAESVDSPLDGVADFWAFPWTDQESTPETLSFDDGVTPAQMLTPQRSPRTASPRTALRPQRSARPRRSTALASVPFMIGDTGAGSCLSFGGLLDVELAHPTLACSRLNISESNTPLPTDRLFYSYRHFHNATPTRVFQFSENFDVDRHTLGGERTFFDKMMSVEIRVPLENRLNSRAGSYAVNADSTLFAPGFDPLFGFGSDKRTELGNISMIFKALLFERDDFALSAGLGVTLPTARSVTFDATIDEFVTFNDSALLARYQIALSSIASNDTLYLSPFLAWIWQKNSRFYHQGFLQVEVAANNSFFTAGGGGVATFDTSGDGVPDPFDPLDEFTVFQTPFPIGVTKIQAQTLMRLNLGWGYVLSENPRADWVQKLTSIFEIHYTTTLNDASINSIPLILTSTTFTGTGLDAITVGNRDNRINIVNVVAGLSANVGNWVVTNGVTAPIRTGADRGFDFEYNLQLQRIF